MGRALRALQINILYTSAARTASRSANVFVVRGPEWFPFARGAQVMKCRVTAFQQLSVSFREAVLH
jgi:hypothetical protein